MGAAILQRPGFEIAGPSFAPTRLGEAFNCSVRRTFAPIGGEPDGRQIEGAGPSEIRRVEKSAGRSSTRRWRRPVGGR